LKKLFLTSLGKLDDFFARVLTVPIRAYRAFLSPLIGHNCRFHPTCSEYALESLKKNGFLFGTPIFIYRLLRCHPFNDGGYDPLK